MESEDEAAYADYLGDRSNNRIKVFLFLKTKGLFFVNKGKWNQKQRRNRKEK